MKCAASCTFPVENANSLIAFLSPGMCMRVMSPMYMSHVSYHSCVDVEKLQVCMYAYIYVCTYYVCL